MWSARRDRADQVSVLAGVLHKLRLGARAKASASGTERERKQPQAQTLRRLSVMGRVLGYSRRLGERRARAWEAETEDGRRLRRSRRRVARWIAASPVPAE